MRLHVEASGPHWQAASAVSPRPQLELDSELQLEVQVEVTQLER